MKRITCLLSMVLLTTCLSAGELPGFGGLVFKSSKAEAEKFIQEKGGTITKNIVTKIYLEKYNQEVRLYNEDYELNKNKKQYKNKKPRSEHIITAYEEKESKLEGQITYAGYEWNYLMKFYDDQFYSVELTIDEEKIVNIKAMTADLDNKISLINSKYDLTVIKDAVFWENPSVKNKNPKNLIQKINYESKDDGCSYFEAEIYQRREVIGPLDMVTQYIKMKFNNYFPEVDEALGITASKMKEVQKAIDEYSEL